MPVFAPCAWFLSSQINLSNLPARNLHGKLLQVAAWGRCEAHTAAGVPSAAAACVNSQARLASCASILHWCVFQICLDGWWSSSMGVTEQSLALCGPGPQQGLEHGESRSHHLMRFNIIMDTYYYNYANIILLSGSTLLCEQMGLVTCPSMLAGRYTRSRLSSWLAYLGWM